MSETAPEAQLGELGRFVAEHAVAGNDVVADKVRTHWVDSVAAACATWQADDGFAGRMCDATLTEGGAATVLGRGVTHPVGAALLNSALIHGCDFDDAFYARVMHAEAPVVGVGIALASSGVGDPDALLDATAVGMEVSLRMALCCTGELSLFDSGFHNSSLFGTFGAAAAASRLLGLDAQRTADALALCASLASGTAEGWNDAGSRAKPLQVGNAAAQGLQAALWARAGLRASPAAVFGRYGFFAAHAGRSGFGLTPLRDGLGVEWALLDSAFKLYPAGAMVQAAIECAVEVRAQLQADGRSAADVTRVELVVPQQYGPVIASLGRSIYDLASAYQAFASWPYNVAVALVSGDVTMPDLKLDRLQADPVFKLAQQTAVRADTSGHGLEPEARPTHLTVQCDNVEYGQSVGLHAGLPDREPHPRVLGKFGFYACSLFGDDRAGAILEAILGLGTTPVPETLWTDLRTAETRRG